MPERGWTVILDNAQLDHHLAYTVARTTLGMNKHALIFYS